MATIQALITRYSYGPRVTLFCVRCGERLRSYSAGGTSPNPGRAVTVCGCEKLKNSGLESFEPGRTKA
jgi:hypothetical protein